MQAISTQLEQEYPAQNRGSEYYAQPLHEALVGDSRRVAVSVGSGARVGVGGRDTYVAVNGVNENVPNVFNLPLARGRYIADLGNTPGHINHWSSRSFAGLVSRHFAVDGVRKPLPWTMVAAHRPG